MCVQFMNRRSLSELAEEYSAEVENDFSWKPHVFPKYPAPVIIESQGKRLVTGMAFGLIPFFEKNIKPKMVFHNARIETISEKPSFRKAFKETRCLIPVDSFFEYVEGEDGKKKLVKFYNQDETPLTAAGIWSKWKSPEGTSINTFSMVTTSPPKIVETTGHDRCPLFLSDSLSEEWLADPPTTTNQMDLFTQYVHEIKFKHEFVVR